MTTPGGPMPTPPPDSTDITRLGLTVRAENALLAAGLGTAGDVRALSDADLLAIRNFGHRQRVEVRAVLAGEEPPRRAPQAPQPEPLMGGRFEAILAYADEHDNDQRLRAGLAYLIGTFRTFADADPTRGLTNAELRGLVETLDRLYRPHVHAGVDRG